ncbi:two-partner secretion domain-containing protein [Polaromonas glacialis]|uniref:two-partner secretion domain-containing protein n=1 Tax=Polaromonas glacialis TaxID=866564 RepID=UPI0018DB4593|nr:MBG domain-containing protein [Polaromonas glacialis]
MRFPIRNFHQSQRTHGLKPTLISIAIMLAFALVGPASALPAGEQTVAGQVAISRPDAQQMVVNQGSAEAIVNWQNFSIGAAEKVDFRQPGASSVILNRVTGNNPSEIFGRMNANGQVFLVNPGGVLFGRTAEVNVGSLVASTLRISNEDFLGGRYQFSAGGAAGAVDNQGKLQAGDRGTIALLGAQASNSGTLTARLGTAALAAGEKISLDFNGDGLTKVKVDQSAINALVANRGMVIADGGEVILTVRAAQALTETVLNQQGVVRARSLVERNGTIVLDGGDTGVTLASGTLDVSGVALGRTGGTAEVLGHHVGLVDQALIDARGDVGGGTILVGGDYQGKNSQVRNAAATFVGPDTILRADALDSGHGGKVIVWSDDATRAHGTISAKGGGQGGDGGFVETSGKFLDVARVQVDASAAKGKAGEWLLDPNDITIRVLVDGGAIDVGVTGSSNFTSTSNDAILNPSTIENVLNTGTNVSVTTGTSGPNGQSGDINVEAPIIKRGGADATLTLNAHRNINFAGSDSIEGGQAGSITSLPSGGRLNVDLNADLDNLNGGAIVMNSGSSIATNGGNVRFYGQSDPANGRAAGSLSSNGNAVRLTDATINASAPLSAGPGGNVVIRGSGLSFDSGEGLIFGEGVRLEGALLQTTTGAISIDGSGGAGANGVSMLSARISTSGGGAIDIRGRAGIAQATESATYGVFSDDTAVFTSGGPGAMVISGESTGTTPGIVFNGGTTIGGLTSTGNITLRALNASNDEVQSDMIELGGTIQSSGVLNLRPGGVSTTGALTEAPAVAIDLFAPNSTQFSLDQNEMTQVIQPGFSSVVIGSAAHTGLITAQGGAPVNGLYDITLQNGGAGSSGIVLANGLSNPGRLVALSSGGTVSQGGAVAAGSLLLHGTQPQSNFQLTNAANSAGTLAAQFDAPKDASSPAYGDVNFVSSGALAIGPLVGTGVDAAANLPVRINAANTVVAGDLLVNTAGNLTLNQRIATLGSDITLVTGGIMSNVVNATLTPGGGGTWKVFADTWVGENRGGLAGSSPNPNFYNCAFGSACAAALPTTGNHFVYRQQPRGSFVLDPANPSRTYGDQNPALAFTPTGLVNGDTFGDAVTGSYLTTATSASNVGNYPVNGNFVSPVGYLIDAAPGTLTVNPATLTYVATPATRLQGTSNPALGGSVSGLVAGDTLATSTTGSFNFSTPADIVSLPGRYAINGSGLSAANYLFQQAPGNATALTVEPAIFGFTPSIFKDVTFASSNLYERNFGAQRLCAGVGPLSLVSDLADSKDPLAVEWSRVRGNPNLSNCIGMVQRYTCDSF